MIVTEASLSRRRLLLGAGLVGGAVLTGTALPGTARAGEAGTNPTTVAVVAGADEIIAPRSVAAGAVTFEVTTPATEGMALLLVRLRVPLATYLADLVRLGRATTKAETIAATAAVESDVRNLGGAVLNAAEPVAFTTVLVPGEYQLITYDFTNGDAVPGAHALTVRGPARNRSLCATGRVVQTPTGFAVPGGRLAASAAHEIVNRSGSLNEAVLLPVVPGTTEADIEAFFTALRNGERPTAYPLTGPPVGSAPLSPGERAVVRTGLKPGPYLLASWVTSTVTGLPRAWGGYHRLVTLA